MSASRDVDNVVRRASRSFFARLRVLVKGCGIGLRRAGRGFRHQGRVRKRGLPGTGPRAAPRRR
ncbi:hypothetical protein F750_6638 [Streptomyces sp. PAMC 26508]|nr:hypothetical protein F750_6638 [Streptomyces sp. PAMC 26508]